MLKIWWKIAFDVHLFSFRFQSTIGPAILLLAIAIRLLLMFSELWCQNLPRRYFYQITIFLYIDFPKLLEPHPNHAYFNHKLFFLCTYTFKLFDYSFVLLIFLPKCDIIIIDWSSIVLKNCIRPDIYFMLKMLQAIVNRTWL